MEATARGVVEGWKEARMRDKERRGLNGIIGGAGGRRSTINGYDRRAGGGPTVISPTLSQTAFSTTTTAAAPDLFPGKKAALKSGANGKKSTVTFDEEASEYYPPDRGGSPFATPIEETISSGPGQRWGWESNGSGMGGGSGGSTTQSKSASAKLNASNMWARDTPSPVQGKSTTTTTSQTKSAFSSSQAAWMKKTPSTTSTSASASNMRTNGGGGSFRSTHATVEDVNSDDDDDDEGEEDEGEDEILVGRDDSTPAPPPQMSASWNTWSKHDTTANSNSSFSRGATPKPDVRPRTMSNARTPWAEASGNGYKPSAFGTSSSAAAAGGGGGQFETWRPGAGISSSPMERSEIGRNMVDMAMQNLSQARGNEDDLVSAMKMYTNAVETSTKRGGTSSGRKR